MKLVKILSLGFVVALASTALVGASSAMAENTALCNVDETPCSPANQTTAVHYEADNILVHTSSMDYECDALLSATPSALGKPQILTATSLVYTSCNQGCTRTVKALGTFSVLRTGADSAEIAGNGFEILVQCGAVLNCTYSFKGLIGKVSGPLLTGDNGHITYTKATLTKIGGTLCPAVATLDALFIALNAVYVTS